MKTQNIVIATVTVITVHVMAMLTSFTASANIYEEQLQKAFGDIISAVSLSSRQHIVSIYTDPETGIMEGQLDVFKFTIDSNGIDLINDAKSIFEQISSDHHNDMISNKELYTLWWSDNGGDFQGYRLYYSPEDAIAVGLACDHCYTAGFIVSNDKHHRKTYTIEWDDASADDSITGRLVTTYAPIKAKSTSNALIIAPDYFDKLIEMRTEGIENYQNELEKAQNKLEKAQDKLEKALSKSQSKSSSFSSSFSSSNSNSSSSSFSSSFSSSNSNSSSSQTVRGQVIDADGESLIGAKVQTVGGGNTVYTDMNGEFSLNIPHYVKTIKVSHLDYKTQVLPVQPIMTITMRQCDVRDEGRQSENDLSDLFLRSKTDYNSSKGKNYSNSWMKKLLFYIEKVQQSGNRYLYLSQLYNLCKDTDGLDQTDLKIAAQQMASVYKRLKSKSKLKENELLFLESMIELIESKIEK